MKYKNHRHGRNARDFEPHRMGRNQGGLRKGRAWRFYDTARLFLNPFEPHSRVTSRMAALPGKHMRRVEGPTKAAHGKSL